MRRGIIMLVAGLCLAGPAMAQRTEKWVERDSVGRTTGTVERQRNGDLVRRDAMGRTVGKDERTDRGYVRRDAMGRTTGKVTKER